MTDLVETTLLPLPDVMDQRDAEELDRSIGAAWSNMMGRAPGRLDVDLRELRSWFDPVAQGQRLRKKLLEIPQLPDHFRDPGPPWTMPAGKGKCLVTPEGRCALDLISEQQDRSTVVITGAQRGRYDRLLANLYRDWSRHRLTSVIDLLEGTTKPLQIPAAAVVIALLVNRCTDESRALKRFASGSAREVVDHAFFVPVQAFSDVLAPARRGNRSDPRLVSGWMLYEARRRLGESLVVDDARAGRDGRVWIQPDGIDHVIDVVARDLVRGHRARATPDLFAAAYDALVDGLRQELPALAGFALVHERPRETAALRSRLVASIENYAEKSA